MLHRHDESFYDQFSGDRAGVIIASVLVAVFILGVVLIVWGLSR